LGADKVRRAAQISKAACTRNAVDAGARAWADRARLGGIRYAARNTIEQTSTILIVQIFLFSIKGKKKVG
jgi:hypothetical protein